MTRQLRRWLDGDAPPEVQRVLASAASDRPDDAQLASLRNKLETALGPGFSEQPALGASEASAIQGAASGSLTATLAITTAIALGLGLVWFTPSATPVQTAPPPPSAASPPLPVREPEPAAETTPAREPERTATPRPARPPRPSTLAEELKQLDAIRRTLPRDPARALAATTQHARHFPQGTLAPERDLLRLEALLRLDRRAEAEQLANRTLPHSPYRSQIQQLMAAPE